MTPILSVHSTSNTCIHKFIRKLKKCTRTHVLIISSNRVHMYPSARIRSRVNTPLMHTTETTDEKNFKNIKCTFCKL